MQRQTQLDALGDAIKKATQGKTRPKSRQVRRAEARRAGKASHDLVEDPEGDRPPNRHKRRTAAALKRRQKKRG